MEGLDFWRLCDELTIVQAALLILDTDPTDVQHRIERKANEPKPEGYEAVKSALASACLLEKVRSRISLYENDYLNNSETTVEVESLKEWLKQKGLLCKFFFPVYEKTGNEFLNSKNPHYAPKLAAAVNAWLAISENPQLIKGKTIKQSLMKWLRENSKEYGFNNEEGLPNDNIIEEVAKIANWDTKGGAPKTPTKEQPTPLLKAKNVALFKVPD